MSLVPQSQGNTSVVVWVHGIVVTLENKTSKKKVSHCVTKSPFSTLIRRRNSRNIIERQINMSTKINSPDLTSVFLGFFLLKRLTIAVPVRVVVSYQSMTQ